MKTYLSKAVVDGLTILGFDRKTIKRVSQEESLEEIFIATLFLNYFIVLIIYILGLLTGGYRIEGRLLNPSVLYGILMIYPFFFNLVVFLLYGLFGAVSELLDKKKHIKPLLSVGYHSAIVYTLIFYIIGLLMTIDVSYGVFLFGAFVIYFIYSMFINLSTIYGFSLEKTLITIFVPFTFIGMLILVLALMFPTTIINLLSNVFA